MLMDHDRAIRYIRRHQCRECRGQSALVLRYHSHQQDDVRCGVCQGDTFETIKSTTQRWRENPESVDVATANRLADKYGDEIREVLAGLPEEIRKPLEVRYFGHEIPTKEGG